MTEQRNSQDVINYVQSRIQHDGTKPSAQDLADRFGYSTHWARKLARRATQAQPFADIIKTRNPMDIIGFIKVERNKLANGEITSLSSAHTMAKLFQYSESQINRILSQANGRETKKENIFPLTRETSSLIGFLTNKGSVQPGGFITIEGATNDPYITIFEKKAEAAFGVITNTKPVERKPGKIRCSFSNKKLARSLGSLTWDRWPQTIDTTHSWISNSPDTMWGLIEGLTESRGNPQIRRKGVRLFFNITTADGVAIIANTLKSLGVNYPAVEYFDKEKTQLAGVSLNNLRDVQFVLSKISLMHPEKKQRAEEIMKVTNEKPIPYVGMFKEWLKIYQSKEGIQPTSAEIDSVKKNGLGEFSQAQIALRFGKGSFLSATATMLRISSLIKQYPYDTALTPDNELLFLIRLGMMDCTQVERENSLKSVMVTNSKVNTIIGKLVGIYHDTLDGNPKISQIANTYILQLQNAKDAIYNSRSLDEFEQTTAYAMSTIKTLSEALGIHRDVSSQEFFEKTERFYKSITNIGINIDSITSENKVLMDNILNRIASLHFADVDLNAAKKISDKLNFLDRQPRINDELQNTKLRQELIRYRALLKAMNIVDNDVDYSNCLGEAINTIGLIRFNHPNIKRVIERVA